MLKSDFTAYQVRLAASREYADAIRVKRAYEELALGFMGLIGEALDLCEKNALATSERDKLLRMLAKAGELVEYRISLSPRGVKRPDEPRGDEIAPIQEWFWGSPHGSGQGQLGDNLAIAGAINARFNEMMNLCRQGFSDPDLTTGKVGESDAVKQEIRNPPSLLAELARADFPAALVPVVGWVDFPLAYW